MAEIRPNALPLVPGGVVKPAAAIIVDDGTGVYQATPTEVVRAGAEFATQSEAQAGESTTKYMSPARTAEAITALGVTEEELAGKEDILTQGAGIVIDRTNPGGPIISSLMPPPIRYEATTLPDGSRYLIPLYPYKDFLDLFVIIGQSNAEGRGNSALSPPAPMGRFISGSTINDGPLVDPVGGAATGSMWPSFANEWFAQTGRMCAFVEVALGGSAILPNQTGPNWSPSGSLRGSAVTAANLAIGAISAESDIVLGSVRYIWVQGEQEAETINGTTITGPLYKAALEALCEYLDENTSIFDEMLIIRTGARNNRTAAAGWAAIRAAQDQACADTPRMRMIYRGTHSFAYGGMKLMKDDVHYDQIGLNLAGKCGGIAASSEGSVAVPPAPNLLSSTVFMDTISTPATSATSSHTTAAGTKALVVAVALVRTTSNTSNNVMSVTFNGRIMTRINTPWPGSVSGAALSPASRTDLDMYMLSETEYGEPLGGVTGNIVVTARLNTNLISYAAFDLNAEAVCDATYSATLVAPQPPASTWPLEVTTGAPALVIAAASSVASSVSVLTWTLAGLSEIGDGGAIDGAQAGQCAFGYTSVAEVTDAPLTATVSATSDAAAFYVAAFRGKVAGE